MLQTADRRFFRLLYICFLIIYMAIREVTPLQFLIESELLSGLVFVLGFALIVWDLFKTRDCLAARSVALLLLFIAICCLSALLNVKFGVSGNIKAIGALVLEYLLLYSAGVGMTAEQVRRELRVLCTVLCTVWGVLTFLSVHMYVFDIEYVVDGASQGFHGEYQRLWGIFQDPSYAGFISLFVIAASVYRMCCVHSVWVRILLSLNILLQFSYVVLGGSRSAFVLLAVATLFVGVCLFVLNEKRKPWQKLRGVLLSFGITCVVVLLFLSMQYFLPLYRYAIRSAIPQTASVHALYDGLYGMTDAKKVGRENDTLQNEGIDFIHRTDTEKEDVSNGRFERWKDTLMIFSKSPIFGTSPRNVSAFAKAYAPDTLMAKYAIAPHSGYLDVLVGAGVLGSAVLGTFLALMAVSFWRIWRSCPFCAERVFSAVSVLLFAGSAVFISDVFFFFTAGAVLFWMMLGYALHTDVPKEEGVLSKWLLRLKRKGI